MDDEPITRLPFVVDEMVIRRVGHDDRHDLLEYLSDPDVVRYQFSEPAIPEQITALIDAQVEVSIGDPGVALMLVAELDRKVIGHCQLTITSDYDRQAEVGFTFHPRFTGRGLATRMVAAALGFAFVQLGMHRVVASTDVKNERSWRLMERLGMRREAHFIHDNLTKGQWMDAYVYAILDNEWRQRHSELIQMVSP